MQVLREWSPSDIKLLNVSIMNEGQENDKIQFDIVSANGRAEIFKQSYYYNRDEIDKITKYSVHIKTQFIC